MPSRSSFSIQNSVTAVAGLVIALVLGFVTRIVFVHTLGAEYLGVNGVISSVLSLLSLAELGVGNAIIFALYDPIAKKDEAAVGALMCLFSRIYRIVGCAIFGIGLILIPFLPTIIHNVPNVENLTAIYLLFLTNTALSYFFSYRRALITANQLDYLSTINTSVFLILQNIFQFILLAVTKNYLFYLAAQLVCTFASNLLISRKALKLYPYLTKYHKTLPDKSVLSSVKVNIRAMFFHQFGSVAVTGTDNLLIAWTDIKLVGLYSNYILIVQPVTAVLKSTFSAVTASIGNLVVTADRGHQYSVYKNIFLVNVWLYGVCAIALDLLSSDFISLCFGTEYVLVSAAVHLIALNFYLMGLRQINIAYINAAGLFFPIRYKSLIEAILNLAVSALFLVGFQMGIFGVLLGTTISTLVTNLWWEPYIVFKHCFDQKLSSYFISLGCHIFIFALAYLSAAILCHLVSWGTLAGFAVKVAVCAILPNLIFFLAYQKTPQFVFLKQAVCHFAGRFARRRRQQ